MYRIGKTFRFSAAHQLAYLPKTHKCSRLHGHNYEVTVTLHAASLDDKGFILDYGYLDVIKKYLDSEIDHRNLNECLPSLNGRTTAENLAQFFYFTFTSILDAPVESVLVKETPDTFAEFWQERGK
jgi:6-pyruvoyltetrahydropterin/6-carboxytetrahydropterin synthase